MVQYRLPRLTDTIKIILIAHGAFYILSIFAPVIRLYFILSLQDSFLFNITLIYRIFTYTLVNPNNIIGLLFFGLFMWWVGSRLEELWGKNTFITFYLITAGVSGILCLLIFHLIGISAFVVGITGITFAIIAVFAFLSPNSPFYIFGIFPLKVKWLLVISLLLTFTDPTPVGILYNLILQIITALVAIIFIIVNFPLPTWASPYLGNLKNRIENIKTKVREKHIQNNFSIYSGQEDNNSGYDSKKVSEETYKWARQEVDKLLDKIRKQGMDSLTKKEKKFLDDHSEDYESSDNE